MATIPTHPPVTLCGGRADGRVVHLPIERLTHTAIVSVTEKEYVPGTWAGVGSAGVIVEVVEFEVYQRTAYDTFRLREWRGE